MNYVQITIPELNYSSIIAPPEAAPLIDALATLRPSKTNIPNLMSVFRHNDNTIIFTHHNFDKLAPDYINTLIKGTQL